MDLQALPPEAVNTPGWRRYISALWNRGSRRAQYIRSIDTVRLEIHVARVSILVGLWLFTFPTFNSPIYSLIRWVMPQYGWGFLFIVVGTAKYLAAYLGSYKVRKYLSLLGFSMWASWWMFFILINDIRSIGSIVYLLFTLPNLAAFLWLAKQDRKVESIIKSELSDLPDPDLLGGLGNSIGVKEGDTGVSESEVGD